mgnify:CR=1 FL=1
MDGAVLYEVVSMTLFTRTFVVGSIVRRLARRVEPRRADRLARLLVFGLVGLVVLTRILLARSASSGRHVTCDCLLLCSNEPIYKSALTEQHKGHTADQASNTSTEKWVI